MTNSTLFSVFSAQISRLISKGACVADVSRMRKFANETTCEFAQGAIDSNVVAAMSNQKAIMRTAQALNFIASGDSAAFDNVTAMLISTILLSTQKTITFSDVHYLIGGNGNENSSHVRGVSRAKLSRFIGLCSNMGTVTSKASRTVGKNGLFSALGISVKSDAHSFTISETAKSNPFVIAYAARLQSMTEGQFELLSSK